MHGFGALPRVDFVGGKVMGVEPIDIVSHAGTRRDLGVIGPCRLEPLVERIPFKVMTLVRQKRAQSAPDHHDTPMRAIGFVGRKENRCPDQAGPHSATVRSVKHAIDADKCAS